MSCEMPTHDASESGGTKRFCFKSTNDSTGHDDVLEIIIPTTSEPNYSSYIWPSSFVLAWYLWDHRKNLSGKRILELGAGTGLPGILVAKCGAYAILSENALLPYSIQCLSRNCELNGLYPEQYEVIGLTWGVFSTSIFKLGSIDFIIASDCFYDPISFEDIIVSVAFLLEKNPQCKFLTVYQERSSDWSIEHLLSKWKLNCRYISLADLNLETDLMNEMYVDRSMLLEIFA